MREATDQTITVVSGLPRSGTSMMMKMLDAGGMEVVTDNIRQADIDNPKGYWEYEPVKKISEDTSWLPATRGRAFKMVSMLLMRLPGEYTYRILFMERDLREVVVSQRKMLERQGKEPAAPDGRMEAMFARHLDQVDSWLAGQENMVQLRVPFAGVLAEPEAWAVRIEAFLDRELDVRAMARVVDPSLYRNRAANLRQGTDDHGTPVSGT